MLPYLLRCLLSPTRSAVLPFSLRRNFSMPTNPPRRLAAALSDTRAAGDRDPIPCRCCSSLSAPWRAVMQHHQQGWGAGAEAGNLLAPQQPTTQLQQGVSGAEAGIHVTSRGRSCNLFHRSCKSRPPVLQTAVAGTAKAGRHCCKPHRRSCKGRPPLLQPPVAGAAKSGRWCCQRGQRRYHRWEAVLSTGVNVCQQGPSPYFFREDGAGRRTCCLCAWDFPLLFLFFFLCGEIDECGRDEL
jgi:hypothetical protein